MISEELITQISHLFCGDTEGYYLYKTGPKLVAFFNQYLGSNDIYKSGFPSRWVYVYNKIIDCINTNSVDTFFNIILGKSYLMREQGISEVKAAELSNKILDEFNQIVSRDFCKITHIGGQYHLVRENEDLEFIGSGGFANVYKQKSTGLIVKKLKDDFLTDVGVRSRFKREYTITKSLQGTFGIIQVYSFDEGNCSYTMEPAETTLEHFVLKNQLNEQTKLNCIRQILYIMSEVHKKDIIHRDISANNIFVISGMLKVADFGLGKDLQVFTSHQTLHTNAMGQYYYCAPEQFMMLKDADKRSDVYSLGRVINFIMTGDARNSHHIYRSVAEKATNSDAAYRYGDATQLSSFFEKAVQYHAEGETKEQAERKIQNRVYDSDVESYIYDMSPEMISRTILDKRPGFSDALITFMRTNDNQAQHIIQSIEQSFRDVCGRSFEANDPFASFAVRVIKDEFSFVVKEIAATMLRYVAWDVNRFSVQHMVRDLLLSDLDPMLKDIIKE